jgi:heterodisulfide reductase subunit B
MYELAVRKVAKVLGIELVDIKDGNCCGLPIEGLNEYMALALAARVLCLAERESLDIAVLCNGCLGSLVKTNKLLKEDSMLRNKLNEVLRETGLEFKGNVKVKHFARILYEDVGVEKIRDLIERSLSDLKIAVQYGCHILHPSDVVLFDHPEFPSTLDELVECLGAKTVTYRGKTRCCGGPILSINEELALKIGKEKINNIADAQVDAIVTICPFCHLMLELTQLRGGYNMPVLFYPQLLGLALGYGSRSLGLYQHKIDVTSLLNKVPP